LDQTWLRFGASLGIGLLIGLERERNPARVRRCFSLPRDQDRDLR